MDLSGGFVSYHSENEIRGIFPQIILLLSLYIESIQFNFFSLLMNYLLLDIDPKSDILTKEEDWINSNYFA
jgi:hypothetical protein